MNAYSLDLRTRIFSYSLTHTVRETAALFHVSPNTVQQLRRLFFETGQLKPRPAGPARPRAVSEDRHHVRYVYLPPYSPELNPIEDAGSKFKHVLKREKARTLDRLLDALHQAAKTITPSEAQAYFQHAEDYSLVTV